jgi:hypothetical protein
VGRAVFRLYRQEVASGFDRLFFPESADHSPSVIRAGAESSRAESRP